MALWDMANDAGDAVRIKREQDNMKKDAEEEGKKAKEEEQKAQKEIENRNDGTIQTG